MSERLTEPILKITYLTDEKDNNRKCKLEAFDRWRQEPKDLVAALEFSIDTSGNVFHQLQDKIDEIKNNLINLGYEFDSGQGG